MTWVPNGVTIIKYVGRMYNHGQNKCLATLNRGNIIIIASKINENKEKIEKKMYKTNVKPTCTSFKTPNCNIIYNI